MASPVVGAVRGVHASSDDGALVDEDAAHGRFGGREREVGLTLVSPCESFEDPGTVMGVDISWDVDTFHSSAEM